MKKSLLSFHDDDEEADAAAAVLPSAPHRSSKKMRSIKLSQPLDIGIASSSRDAEARAEAANYYSAENLNKLRQEQRFVNIVNRNNKRKAIDYNDTDDEMNVVIDDNVGEEELVILDGDELESHLDDDDNLLVDGAHAPGTLRNVGRKGTLSTKEAIANDSNANYINDDFLPFSHKTANSSRVYMAGDVDSSTTTLGKRLSAARSIATEEDNDDDDDLEWKKVMERKVLVNGAGVALSSSSSAITIDKMIDILIASQEKLRRRSEINGEKISGIEKEIEDIKISSIGNIAKLNEKVDSYNYFVEFRTYLFEIVYMLREKKAAVNAVRHAVIENYRNQKATFVDKLRFLQRTFLHCCDCADADLGGSTEDIILYNNNKLSLEKCLSSSGLTIADLISSNLDAFSIIGFDQGACARPLGAARKGDEEEIGRKIADIFSDTKDELSDVELVIKRLDGFRSGYSEYYKNAFFSLCIPQILVPFIELDIFSFYNHCSENSVINLKQRYWFNAVKQYTIDGEVSHKDESDATLLPKLVVVAMVPFLADYVKAALNPLDRKVCVEVSETINLLLNFQPNENDITLIVSSVVDIFSNFISNYYSGDAASSGGVLIMPNFAKHYSQQSRGISRYFREQMSMLTKIFENLHLFSAYINASALMRVAWDFLSRDGNVNGMLSRLAESEGCSGGVRALLGALVGLFPPPDDLIRADISGSGAGLVRRLLAGVASGTPSQIANLIRDVHSVDIFK